MWTLSFKYLHSVKPFLPCQEMSTPTTSGHQTKEKVSSPEDRRRNMPGDEGEGDEERAPSVLWERCIQQSILVDISGDDSLHLSDLQPGSFSICLSQNSALSEPSINLSEYTELSDTDEEGEATSDTNVTTSWENVTCSGRNKQDSPRQSVQRPRNTHGERSNDEDPVNTSDEDQEDLPYDDGPGDQEVPCFAHRKYSGHKKSKVGTDMEQQTPQTCTDANMALTVQEMGEDVSKMHRDLVQPTNKNRDPNITDLLSRHFSPEELLNPSRYIAAETLPEVSLMESLDETVVSRLSSHHSPSGDAVNGVLLPGASESVHAVEEPDLSQLSEAPTPSETEQEVAQSNTIAGPDPTKEDAHAQNCLPGKARCSTELKYGQGQVHYPLPDFSKVAPKVKIPKGKGTAKPACKSPGIQRAHSSPGILNKPSVSTMDIISRVLEDSCPPPERTYIFDGLESPSGVFQHLQAEYDELVTKCAKAEHLVGTQQEYWHPLSQQTEACSEPSLHIDWSEKEENEDVKPAEATKQHKTVGPVAKEPALGCGAPLLAEGKNQSEGEKLTCELMDVIGQFVNKVEEFKKCLNTMSINVEEQQMVFKTLMDAQDQLERNYISKKEAHRALEMQSYMGLNKHIGQFDPDRQVEGEIFRIGMHLEDIKEQIDSNVCQRLSPPPSSSTPTPPTPLSPRAPLHEDPVLCFSPIDDKLKDKEKTPGDSPPERNGEISNSLQHSDVPLDRLVRGRARREGKSHFAPAGKEDYDGVSALPVDVTDRRWITEKDDSHVSCLTGRSGSGSECSRGCVVRVSCSPSLNPLDSLDASLGTVQRIVQETDSGFGSSDLSRSATGLSQLPSHSERQQFLSSVTFGPDSMSDSETSASNVETITTAANQSALCHPRTGHWQKSRVIDQSSALPSESRTASQQGDSGDLQTSDQVTHQSGAGHLSISPQGQAIQPHICTCHNEAILSLQSEVSRLKRELEASLFHLPHLAIKMDYLAYRYKQERRTKARHRTRSSRHPGSNSSLKVEDWISSDMDQSKGEDGSSSSEHNSTLRRIRCGRTHQSTSYSSPGNMGICELKKDLQLSPHQKPLMQVNYGSCSSLPAGFKVMETQSQPIRNHQTRSTQSDSALLPSNLYFQWPLTAPGSPSNPTSSRSRSRKSREEDISRTLDKAIEAAQNMKRTTDRMAKSLSADLAKAELYRKLHGLYPPEKLQNTIS
ncbi:protein AKNAD1 isoform X2 [Denticeps clupeoides]|uniref:protein AKNAD1 isoform X2 n=1 Tax=Denticeps clupeoides TaxID=299321 RepID=UPI0010A373D1|nr:protein AKNAD1 isoform X2 [Denticeps clupeoides]